ncbi:MAG: hypothetical protein ABI361_08175 [Nitrososphaera sp.]|jgi:hypothetical protein
MGKKSAFHESPESSVRPYEDLSTMQRDISGEAIAGPALGICDACFWSYTAINHKGVMEKCALCGGRVSVIPLSAEETTRFEYSSKRGLTLRFGRKLPLR